MIKIAPSILSADFLTLGEQVQAAERAGADRFHIDVMDGLFVPNITVGMLMVEAMRRATSRPLEVHLMIVQPERHVEAFARSGADTLVIHQEASPHLDRFLQLARSLGRKAGVALNPATPAAVLEEIIEQVDLVLVMTVNPGFGGQQFIEYTLKKIRDLRRMLDARNATCELEVDGGIGPQNVRKVVEAEAQVFVAGTAVFGHPGGPRAGLEDLQQAAHLASPLRDPVS